MTGSTAAAKVLLALACLAAVGTVVLLLTTPRSASARCTEWAADRGYDSPAFSPGKKRDNCRAVAADGSVRYHTATAPVGRAVWLWLGVAATLVLLLGAARAHRPIPAG